MQRYKSSSNNDRKAYEKYFFMQNFVVSWKMSTFAVAFEKIINQLINDKYESIRNRFHFDSRFV